jgi:hypothetical protein
MQHRRKTRLPITFCTIPRTKHFRDGNTVYAKVDGRHGMDAEGRRVRFKDADLVQPV